MALSGDKEDIYKTDEAIMNLFPDNDHLARWLTMAQEKVAFQGLPARICWLGYGERAKAGLKLNEMVASGELKAPIVIGRDHLDCGSVASPNRETEAMKDGSDAIADWVYLNAMINAVGGATWVRSPRRRRRHRLQPPRRAGDSRRRHSRSRETIERVLTTDPGSASSVTPTPGMTRRSVRPQEWCRYSYDLIVRTGNQSGYFINRSARASNTRRSLHDRVRPAGSLRITRCLRSAMRLWPGGHCLR